jgi:hypothetical protein
VYQCAAALSALFDAKRNGAAFPAIDALFCDSLRQAEPPPGADAEPRPLSGVLGIDINDKFGDKHDIGRAPTFKILPQRLLYGDGPVGGAC